MRDGCCVGRFDVYPVDVDLKLDLVTVICYENFPVNVDGLPVAVESVCLEISPDGDATTDTVHFH